MKSNRDQPIKFVEEEEHRKKGDNVSENMAAKSKRKVEKLRKQLEKEEKRIAKAEAKAFGNKGDINTKAGSTDISTPGDEIKQRKRQDSRGSINGFNAYIEDTDLVKSEFQETASLVPDPLTPTSQPALADEERSSSPKALNADVTPIHVNSSIGQESDGPSFPDMDRSLQDSSPSMSNLSSDTTSADSEDTTSSNGSSSDDDSDNGAPDEASTKRNGPQRIAPPGRAKPKQICRAFLHKGLCKQGSRCKYLHELPERGSRGTGRQEVKRAKGGKERVGLYQRVSHHVQHKILAITHVLTTCSSSL